MSSNRIASLDMARIFHVKPDHGLTEIKHNHRRKKLHRKMQGRNILGSSFTNTENVKTAIQLQRERQM